MRIVVIGVYDDKSLSRQIRTVATRLEALGFRNANGIYANARYPHHRVVLDYKETVDSTESDAALLSWLVADTKGIVA